jgi:regulatory protein
MLITGLEPVRGGKSVVLVIDGSRRVTIEAEAAAEAKLAVGYEISATALSRLSEASRFQQALDRALHFLEYRSRSEKEISDRLRRYGYSLEICRRAVALLRSRKLLDDRAFAESWRDGRNHSNPRSYRMLKKELLAKGVNRETAETVAGEVDDEASALKVARKSASALKRLEYREFREKLGSYLQRRGFNYDVINKTVKRIWQEKQEG